MQNPSIESLAERLQRLLSDERDLLMRGEVHSAFALTGEKLAALDALQSAIGAGKLAGRAPAGLRSIERVKAMAAENAVHFDAVRNGLLSLAARLDEMNGGQSVGAYAQNGAKVPFSAAIGRYNKRV